MFPWEDQTFNKEAFQIVEEGVNVIGREGAIEALVDSKMLGFQAAADVLTPHPQEQSPELFHNICRSGTSHHHHLKLPLLNILIR